MVDALREAWGSADRGVISGIANRIGNRLKRAALNIGTNKVARKRGAVSDAAYPAAGDVLMYQTRGKGIRDFIEGKIATAPKPLIVLAHSRYNLGLSSIVELIQRKPQQVEAEIAL